MAELSRRGFVGGVVGMAAGALAAYGAEPPKRRPNVIVIVSDDQGAADLGCYGAKDLVTPNLDALAGRGVRFTQFYAAGAMCSPSRAAILTGQYPQRVGLAGNAGSKPGEGGLSRDAVTMAQMLKEAGYVTGQIGKWHLGYSKESMPNAKGFDYSFGFMGGCIDNYSHFYYWGGPNRHDLWRQGKEVWHEGEYFGDLCVRECKQFIEQNKDRPFFLYYAINKPHYPLQGTKKWREKYKNLPEVRGMYAAAVSTLDEEIGQVLAKVEELGLTEDTIVIFQSDQGHSTEERGFGGGGDAGRYRGAKGCFFEGAVRMPAIISWPGKVPRGEVRGQMCGGWDWMPTVAELTGAKLPGKVDGMSMMGWIRDGEARSEHKALHWAMGKQWAVREGDWKLLGNPVDESKKGAITKADELFLVNLAEDVGEMKNLTKQKPEVVQRLKELHDAWAKEVKAQ